MDKLARPLIDAGCDKLSMIKFQRPFNLTDFTLGHDCVNRHIEASNNSLIPRVSDKALSMMGDKCSQSSSIEITAIKRNANKANKFIKSHINPS